MRDESHELEELVSRPIDRRKFILGAAGAAAGLALPGSALARLSVAANSKTIAFAQPDTSASVYPLLLKGAKQEASKRGYQLLESHANHQLDAQVNELNTWIAQGIGGVIVLPLDNNAMLPLIKKAHDANVKFLDYSDKALPGTDGWVIFNNLQGAAQVGADAGRWINKTLGGNAKVALLTHEIQQTGRDRIHGGIKALQKVAPKAKVVAKHEGVLAAECLTVTQSLLQAHPDLNVILCIADDGALGAEKAFMQTHPSAARQRHDVHRRLGRLHPGDEGGRQGRRDPLHGRARPRRDRRRVGQGDRERDRGQRLDPDQLSVRPRVAERGREEDRQAAARQVRRLAAGGRVTQAESAGRSRQRPRAPRQRHIGTVAAACSDARELPERRPADRAARDGRRLHVDEQQLPHASQPDGDPAAGLDRRPRRDPAGDARALRLRRPLRRLGRGARGRGLRPDGEGRPPLARGLDRDRARGRRRVGADERLPDQLPRLLADHRHARRLRRRPRRGRHDHPRRHAVRVRRQVRLSRQRHDPQPPRAGRDLPRPLPRRRVHLVRDAGRPPHDGDRRGQDVGARARRVGEADPLLFSTSARGSRQPRAG